jgi:hypothetical protein
MVMAIIDNQMLWRQFGAAIDMLENALRACPDELWSARLVTWQDSTDEPGYMGFWDSAYHALFWLDLYLSGTREGFVPPAPFVIGAIPEKPYTKEELQAYLDHCRQKCRATIETLTEEKASHWCKFPWVELSFMELQLYSMRHVQEHASQLNLFLGQKLGSAPDWVTKTEDIAE